MEDAARMNEQPSQSSPTPQKETFFRRYVWPDWQRRKAMLYREAWFVVLASYPLLLGAYLVPFDWRNDSTAFLLFWWSLLHEGRRAHSYGIAVFCLFITSLHTGVLGILLTLSRRLWYPGQGALAAEQSRHRLGTVGTNHLLGLVSVGRSRRLRAGRSGQRLTIDQQLHFRPVQNFALQQRLSYAG